MDNSLDMVKEFDEEAYTLAFHPSGHHLAVGFADKIRLINILISDLIPFKEINFKVFNELIIL